jgi:paraquat-inducible protein A
MPRTTNNLTACPECDLLQRAPSLPPGGLAECARCGACLFRERPSSLDHTLAYAVAAAVLFVLANSFVLMGLDAKGIRTDAHLWQTAWRLHEHGMTSVAILALMTVIVVPAMQLASLLYMLVPLRLGIHPLYLHHAFRIFHHSQPWAMVEVFVLGSIVSLVKLTQVATVEPQAGLYCLGGYVVLLAAALGAFEPHEMWRRAEDLGMTLPAAEAQARA